MNKESKEFALVLFDSLARRRGITGDSIDLAQLKDFWDQITDQSFDSRLQTFFDMYPSTLPDEKKKIKFPIKDCN